MTIVKMEWTPHVVIELRCGENQIIASRGHLEALPLAEDKAPLTPVLRHVLRLETELATATADDFDPARLAEAAGAATELSSLLAASHLR